MLFNSYEFIFVFLPLSVAGFVLASRWWGNRAALTWLVLASLFFYGWWNPVYLGLLIPSIIGNFWLGSFLARQRGRQPALCRVLFIAGVGADLGLIGYYKYAHFFLDSWNTVTGGNGTLEAIVLPLAISFFTFQQITFLVDSYRGETKEYDFINYALFVTFFPQLIAGPIVHHKEMMPQFAQRARFRVRDDNLAVGVSIFAMGLFKKAVLADGIAVYASPVFAASEAGEAVSFFTAWGGALAYTFQLYFDFSGYSDMAIGAARIFGIKLPLNFNSPYKAVNIAEFWRRWHMTLSRFLRDYLYIALGGNRRGPARRHVNLMITMLLGGLWHGAAWTFVVWGALHGAYLVINHGWHAVRRKIHGGRLPAPTVVGHAFSVALTFLVVVIGWVFFRSLTFDGAALMLQGMAGMNGVSLPAAVGAQLPSLLPTLTAWGITMTPGGGETFLATWGWIAVLWTVAWFMPNTQEVMARYEPAYVDDHSPVITPARPLWRPSMGWAVLIAATAVAGVLALPQVSEFLYFQF